MVDLRRNFIFGPIAKKGAKSLPWAENFSKLLIVMAGKFKFSAQGSDLAPFVGNGTKIKISSDIKQPLVCKDTKLFFFLHIFLCFSCLPCLFKKNLSPNFHYDWNQITDLSHDFRKWNAKAPAHVLSEQQNSKVYGPVVHFWKQQFMKKSQHVIRLHMFKSLINKL